MRIRKNTKLSSMLLATTGYAGEKPETYVCLLNQSPWDVTFSGDDNELTNLLESYWFLPPPPLLPSSSSSSPPPFRIQKFNREDSFNEINVSLGDSNGVTERLENLVTVKRSPEVKESMKSKPVELNSPVKTSDDDEKVAAAVVSMPAPPKRGRPRGTGKKTPATTVATANPYEFYYYSGFGPRWGRKRGGSDNGGENNNNVSKKSSGSSEDGGSDKTAAFMEGSSSFDEFEFMEEDFDNVVDQEDDSDHGKKKKKKKKMTTMTMKTMVRKRKPVKERSLKSLM